MELNKIPQWMLALEPEDAAFLKNFALKSGSCLLYTSRVEYMIVGGEIVYWEGE